MKKTTVFEGFINGEKFDNVTDYNNRMTQLLEAGATDINAKSSTSIKMVQDETLEAPKFTTTTTADVCPRCEHAPCACDGCENHYDLEEYNLFPFFEDNDYDTTYLDTLVSDDHELNKVILSEMDAALIDARRDVTDFLYSLDINRTDKEDYLEEIRNILVTLNVDTAKNQACIDSIDDKRKAVEAKFEAARKEYNETIAQLDTHHHTLTQATPVLNRLLEFYRGAEVETIAALVEMKEVEEAHEDLHNTKTDTDKPVRNTIDFAGYLAKVAKLYGIEL
jgi:hypothetical protein